MNKEILMNSDSILYLTKREFIASQILSGLLAKNNINGIITNRVMVPDIAAEEAVSYADELLKRLERKGE